MTGRLINRVRRLEFKIHQLAKLQNSEQDYPLTREETIQRVNELFDIANKDIQTITTNPYFRDYSNIERAAEVAELLKKGAERSGNTEITKKFAMVELKYKAILESNIREKNLS